MLLAEYAITPDVFDTMSYASEELCGARLDNIREALLNEALVRDLRDGAWSRLFVGDHRPWHRRAKELMKKLVTQKRLVRYAPTACTDPTTDTDWCDEALETHTVDPLDGIIVTNTIADGYRNNQVVAPIDRLGSAPWWAGRSPSMRLRRTLDDYKAALGLVLRYANSIMFIDPHLDPTKHQYKDFISLVQGAGGRIPKPFIEIHRVCYRSAGPERKILDLDDLEAIFFRALSDPLAAVGLEAEVFIWDDFHDRYVISDLVGISLQNGLDTTAAGTRTTWTRLGRLDRDDIQREFDPASERHKLHRRFNISR